MTRTRRARRTHDVSSLWSVRARVKPQVSEPPRLHPISVADLGFLVGAGEAAGEGVQHQGIPDRSLKTWRTALPGVRGVAARVALCWPSRSADVEGAPSLLSRRDCGTVAFRPGASFSAVCGTPRGPLQ